MRIAAGILAAAMMIAGCGGTSAGGRPLAHGDAARLRREVGAIRAAAAAHDPRRARTAVATLRGEIDRLLRLHRLSAGDGRVMLTVLARAESRITTEVQRRATSTSATSTSATTRAAPSTTRSAPSTTRSAPSTTRSTSSTTPSTSATTPVTSPAPTHPRPGPPPGHGHGPGHGPGPKHGPAPGPGPGHGPGGGHGGH